MTERWYRNAMLGLGSLVVGALLAGCGDDGGDPGELPGPVDQTITLAVVPSAELAANGGEVHVGFVAYQDGDGPWLPMTASGDLYQATVTSKRYGVAVGCTQHVLPGTTLAATFISLQHATVAEATALSDFSCVDVAKGSRLSGTATGLPTATSVFRLGTGEGSSNTSARADGFSVAVRAAPLDVVGYFDGGSPAASKVVRLAAVDPKSGAPLHFDFAAAAAPQTFPVTAPAGAQALVSAHVRTSAGGQYLHLWSTAGQLSYTTMPRSLLRAGDLIRVGITATQAGASQESFLYLAEPGPAALTFGPTFSPTAAPATAGTSRSASFAFGPSWNTLPLVDYQLTASTRVGQTLTWHTATVSLGWLQDQGAAEYRLPDLSALPGFASTMALPSGVPLRWQVARTERSAKAYEPGLMHKVHTVSGELAN